jgi:hypothetical protein
MYLFNSFIHLLTFHRIVTRFTQPMDIEIVNYKCILLINKAVVQTGLQYITILKNFKITFEISHLKNTSSHKLLNLLSSILY